MAHRRFGITRGKSPRTRGALAVKARYCRELILGIIPLITAGIVRPMMPQRLIGIGYSFLRWGLTPAGLVAIAARRSPHQTAVIDDRGSISYLDLDRQAAQLAVALTGVKVIGVLARNSRLFPLLLAAAGRNGQTIVLLNTGSESLQMREIIREQKIEVLILDTEFIPLVERVTAKDLDVTVVVYGQQECLPQGWLHLSQLPARGGKPAFRPPSSRTIVLTSGTTGVPKGAKRPEPKDWMPAVAMTSMFPMKQHERVLVSCPIFHTWGLAALQINLALCATFVMERKPSPHSIISAASEHKVSGIYIVPTMLDRILELETIPDYCSLPNLMYIASSGSAITTATVRKTHDKFGPVLYNLYGSTEAAWTTVATPRHLLRYPNTAGKCPPGTRLKILNEARQEVPAGEIGSIFVGNGFVFDGYTRSGEEKESINGLINTGDLGYVTAEGLLFVQGREDDMIVSGGENVYPSEVENMLSQHARIKESAVIGVDDTSFGKRLIAYVVKTDSLEDCTAEEVCDFIRQRLTRFCVPRDVVFLDELPRNATGKVVPNLLPTPDDIMK